MRRSRQTAVALARFAILGIVVYVALDVALVFLRPHFSVLHNAESDYGASGSYAWVMDLNFLLRGAFSLAVVRALVLAGALRGPRGLGRPPGPDDLGARLRRTRVLPG